MEQSDITYLDNNATTFMPMPVIKEMFAWVNRGNPSSDYKSAQKCQELINNFKEYIAKVCKFKICSGSVNSTLDECVVKSPSKEHYRIIFTSCASESNCTLIRTVADAYEAKTQYIPHIIVSAIEHKSILNCVRELAENNRIQYTEVPCNLLGFVTPEAVSQAIRPNTCLISVMYANNETGAINDIREIGKLAHKHKIPFHTDAVQAFGKYTLRPIEDNIDAATVSFHKMHGPVGIGMLIIKEQFLRGYGLKSCISGTQNDMLRGGTENIMAIAGAYAAFKHIIVNRNNKNEHMKKLKRKCIEDLQKYIPCKTYLEYLQTKNKPRQNAMEIIFLSTAENKYLPNTLLLSVVKRTKPEICNIEIKKKLQEHKIVVSIGSACNTHSTKASHVLTAMDADDLIKKGTMRISLSDDSTEDDINQFVKCFTKILQEINKK